MSLASYKITDAAVDRSGVIAAPDKLTGTAAQNKMVFDRLIRETVKELFNGLIDTLAGAGGASEIGTAEIGGLVGGDVQTALGSLKTLLDTKSADADVTAALALKSDRAATDLHVKSVSFNARTGAFTFTHEDGRQTVIDTALEKVATNWEYDADNQALALTLADGTIQLVPLSSFITETEFLDSGQIAFSVSNHRVTATVKTGSITEAMLSSALAAQLRGYVQNAANSAAAAAQHRAAAEGFRDAAGQDAADAAAAADAAETSETAATASADLARSWARGGTGTRAGEDTDNARYWCEQARVSAGVTSFNGRGGAVTPQYGDYESEDVSYDPSLSGLKAQAVRHAIDELAGRKLYTRTFAASEWTAGTDGVTLTIPAAQHGITGSDVLAQFFHLSGGSYVAGTWACLQSRAEIGSDRVVTLRAAEAYAGKVVLYG